MSVVSWRTAIVQLPTFMSAMRAESLSLFERTLRELYATRTPFIVSQARRRG